MNLYGLRRIAFVGILIARNQYKEQYFDNVAITV
jgi:hypothetical protein